MSLSFSSKAEFDDAFIIFPNSQAVTLTSFLHAVYLMMLRHFCQGLALYFLSLSAVFVPPSIPNYNELETWSSSTLSTDPNFISACKDMAGWERVLLIFRILILYLIYLDTILIVPEIQLWIIQSFSWESTMDMLIFSIILNVTWTDLE